MTDINVLVIGANSAIAEEITKNFATKDNANLFLVARNQAKLDAIADEMKVLGAQSIKKYYTDLALLHNHQNLIDQIFFDAGQKIDYIIIAHGSLSNEERAKTDIEYALNEINLNLNSYISLSLLIANKLENQKHGNLALISSVAGDRGRSKICLYACAKSGITTLGQALSQRLHKNNINVLTVKPGVIDTPMTKTLKHSLLTGSSKNAGLDIYNAIKSRKKQIYTPWFWRIIMLIIRLLPQEIFLKTKF
jgi:decaprenylphospho-beta-D-erythro-pentofuranosid-2-ulose 2-reductase